MGRTGQAGSQASTRPEAPTRSEPIERFATALRANTAGVHGPLPSDDLVAALVARAVELDGDISGEGPIATASPDPVLDPLGVRPALERSSLEVLAPDSASWEHRVAAATVGVTGAARGAAETGTVLLPSAPGAPRSVSLLPDAHLCVLRAADVVERLEDAFKAVVRDGLPSNLVWISGPSRSADIEKRITLGVHGPRTFEVFLLEE